MSMKKERPLGRSFLFSASLLIQRCEGAMNSNTPREAQYTAH